MLRPAHGSQLLAPMSSQISDLDQSSIEMSHMSEVCHGDCSQRASLIRTAEEARGSFSASKQIHKAVHPIDLTMATHATSSLIILPDISGK